MGGALGDASGDALGDASGETLGDALGGASCDASGGTSCDASGGGHQSGWRRSGPVPLTTGRPGQGGDMEEPQ